MFLGLAFYCLPEIRPYLAIAGRGIFAFLLILIFLASNDNLELLLKLMSKIVIIVLFFPFYWCSIQNLHWQRKEVKLVLQKILLKKVKMMPEKKNWIPINEPCDSCHALTDKARVINVCYYWGFFCLYCRNWPSGPPTAFLSTCKAFGYL